MKILLLRASPRKDGATNRLADAFVSGARSVGAEVEDVNLCEKNISYCKGCYACASKRSQGCVIADDMQGLLGKLKACDVLVCFSPVYFYGMSAQLKTFFDRCFPLVSRRDVPFGNVEKNGKKMIAFSVASGRAKAFECITKNFEMISSELGFELSANVRRGEGVYFSELGENSIRVKKIFSAVEQLGAECVKNNISAETISNAELEIAPSDEMFATRAKAYWHLLQR